MTTNSKMRAGRQLQRHRGLELWRPWKMMSKTLGLVGGLLVTMSMISTTTMALTRIRLIMSRRSLPAGRLTVTHTKWTTALLDQLRKWRQKQRWSFSRPCRCSRRCPQKRARR